MAAILFDAFQLGREIDVLFPIRNLRRDIIAHSLDLSELRLGSFEDGGRVAKMLEQLADADRSDVLGHVQRNESFLGFHGH